MIPNFTDDFEHIYKTVCNDSKENLYVSKQP